MKHVRLALMASAALLATTGFSAAPTVSNVTMAQDADTHLVTISYALSAPGIVTLSIETNTAANAAGAWVAIGSGNVGCLRGDVNRLIESATGTKTIHWLPQKSWPGHVFADGRVRAKVTAYALDDPPNYFAVDLGTLRDVFFYADAASVPGGVTNARYKTEMLLMRKIPAANVVWRMSSPSTEPGRNKYKEAARQVMLTADYYMGVYELTQCQYQRVMGANPSTFQGASYPDAMLRPVENANASLVFGLGNEDVNASGYVYHANNSVIGRINAGCATMPGFRVPTEAQWEFACRAGTGGCHYLGTDAGERVDEIAWYAGNWQNDPMSVACGNVNQTHAVGQLRPNGFGLYDTLGNVAEWISDYQWVNNYWWNDVPDFNEVQVDPYGASTITSSMRTLKGGSYLATAASGVRAAVYDGLKNHSLASNVGIRLSCPAVFVNPSAP